MPSTIIEVRHPYSPDDQHRLIEAVHAALVEGFRIPLEDRCVRLVIHAPHAFGCSLKYSAPERATVVTVTAFAGRSLDAKRRLYAAIVERLAPLGIPRDHVKIILVEVPRENWGLRGGQPGSEIDLGFDVEV